MRNVSCGCENPDLDFVGSGVGQEERLDKIAHELNIREGLS
jgi:hypothetical protein